MSGCVGGAAEAGAVGTHRSDLTVCICTCSRILTLHAACIMAKCQAAKCCMACLNLCPALHACMHADRFEPAFFTQLLYTTAFTNNHQCSAQSTSEHCVQDCVAVRHIHKSMLKMGIWSYKFQCQWNLGVAQNNMLCRSYLVHQEPAQDQQLQLQHHHLGGLQQNMNTRSLYCMHKWIGSSLDGTKHWGRPTNY